MVPFEEISATNASTASMESRRIDGNLDYYSLNSFVLGVTSCRDPTQKCSPIRVKRVVSKKAIHLFISISCNKNDTF